MPSKDERMLKAAFNALKEKQETLSGYYEIEFFKRDFIKRYKKLKTQVMILTAKETAKEFIEDMEKIKWKKEN